MQCGRLISKTSRRKCELLRQSTSVGLKRTAERPQTLLQGETSYSAPSAVVFIASRQQGGRQGNRKLLNRVKSVLDTLCRVKKYTRLKLGKLTVNFLLPKLTVKNPRYKNPC